MNTLIYTNQHLNHKKFSNSLSAQSDYIIIEATNGKDTIASVQRQIFKYGVNEFYVNSNLMSVSKKTDQIRCELKTIPSKDAFVNLLSSLNCNKDKALTQSQITKFCSYLLSDKYGLKNIIEKQVVYFLCHHMKKHFLVYVRAYGDNLYAHYRSLQQVFTFDLSFPLKFVLPITDVC